MLRSILLGIFLTLISWTAGAVQPLSSSQAFVFTYVIHNNALNLQWKIAPQYFLYRDRISWSVLPDSQVKLGAVSMPPAHAMHQTVRGPAGVFEKEVSVAIPLSMPAEGLLKVQIKYQGCSSEGFCYAPLKKTISLNVTGAETSSTEQTLGFVHALLTGQNLFLLVLGFLGLGVLLAFTPCVLPMVPILSSIIVGQHKHGGSFRGFSLSLAYVLGMALTYALAGILVAYAGQSIQVQMQKPIVLVLYSGVFVILAFSLFGWFSIQMPNGLKQRLTYFSHRQKGGTHLGVFVMGSLSSLIVSPCVSAPLVGVLAYIAQSGDKLLGGLALFSLGLGMGVPLLLIGTSAGKLLPKAGAWMQTLEKIFGLMMLAIAIWILSRILPGSITLLLWALLVSSAVFLLGFFSRQTSYYRLRQSLGFIFLAYAFVLLLGGVTGHKDPLHPLENLTLIASHTVHDKKINFFTLSSHRQFDCELALAKQFNKPVLLDFYADWCDSCVAMDRNVFTQKDIIKVLDSFVLLRANITDNTVFDQVFMKRFNVIAPPTILFFDSFGNEIAHHRIIGEVSAKELLAHLIKTEDITSVTSAHTSNAAFRDRAHRSAAIARETITCAAK